MSNYSEIPNNSTDCISRQAVIDSLYDWSNHSITDAETWHLRQVIGDIKSMPSVTPQLTSELEKNSKKLEKDFGELDCISREQALNEFCIYNSYDSIGVDKVRSYLKDLPSVTPQEPRWILVSEKLPDIHNYSEKYLVTLERGGVHIAMFTECDGKSWWTYDDVTAWMPLPKQYEPQESEG